MKQLKLMKTLLVAVGLLLGTSAWADTTLGNNELTTDYLTVHSTVQTIADGGSMHYTFTQKKPEDANWKGWILWAGTTGAEVNWANGISIVRGDNWDDKYPTGNNNYGSNAPCTNTFTWGDSDDTKGCHPTFCANMNGATFDMTITYSGGTFEMTTTASKGGSDLGSYTCTRTVDGAPSSIDVCLSLNQAQLTITEETYTPPYYNITRYFQDYEDATTYANGWSTTRDSWSQKESNGGHVFGVDPSNATTYTLSFADNNYFKTVSDYSFSFEYAFSSGNGNAGASSLIIKDTEGNTLFTLSNTGNWSETCDGTYGETTITEVYHAPYNDLSAAIYATITLTANSESGLVLSVTGTNSTITNNKKEKTVGVINSINKVRIADFCRIGSIVLNAARGASHYAFDNMTLKEHTVGAVAEDPTFAFKSVSGENRVYTITNPNGEGTLYYTTTTAAEAPAVGNAAYTSTTDASIDVPFGTGTYYAYVVLDDGTTTSAVVSQEVTGGAIQLDKPYYTIVSYNSEATATTVTLNTNVSRIIGTPTATIKYTIDDGEEQSTTNGGSVAVVDGSTISFYAVAEGYTNSETVEEEATAPNTNPELWSETYNGKVSANSDFSLGADIVSTVNATNYYNLYYNSGATLVSENLLANNVGSNYMMRANGLYPGGSWYLAIKDLKVGDYVTINGVYGNDAFGITGNSTDVTSDAWHTIAGQKYCFTVKKEGTARFTMNRYGYIQSITVQRALATPGATVGSTGFATFAANVDLDLSTLTDGFTAYFASAPADGKVTMTKATSEKIAAGEGLLIEGSGDFTITETRDATADVDNYLVAGDGVENGIAKEDGFDKYVLGAYKESVAFFLINGTPATVPANKAYLKVPNGSGSARLAIVFDEDATGINAVENNVKMTEGYYNLAGQRVAQPTKGLYILNGKKVVIK